MANTKKQTEPATTIKELEAIVTNRFGAGAIMRGSDPSLEIEVIPSGILSVDIALNGGFPRGRTIEVYGSFGVGKSYLSLKVIAEAQAMGLRAAYVDAEGTFNAEFAESAGVDIDELDYHRQKSGNQAVDFIELLLRSKMYGVIVIDSIASLIPKQELEQDMEQSTMGTFQARLMSAALRRLTTANSKTVLFFVNQQRETIGSMFKQMVTSGGRAMGFYATTRLELVRSETLKATGKVMDPNTGKYKESSKIVVGHRVLVKVSKDKRGVRPMSETTFVFDYEQGGVDPIEDLIYLGRTMDLVQINGNKWWVDEYEEDAQTSRKKFVKWLRKNKAVAEELEELIREKALDGE